MDRNATARTARGVRLSLLVLGAAEQFAPEPQGFFSQLEIARMRNGAL
jgi:hypothetical protein